MTAMPSVPTERGIDLVDLRAVADFEKSVNAFRAVLDAFEPVLDRLEDAKYPGAEDIECFWPDLENLAGVLEDMREAGGDQAAWDYRMYGAADDLAGAIGAMLDGAPENVSRVAPLIRYAESVA